MGIFNGKKETSDVNYVSEPANSAQLPAVTTAGMTSPMQLSAADAAPAKKIIDDSKTYLDDFKLTYGVSKQFEDEICKIGEQFLDGMNLGNENDVCIPYFGYQVLAMDGSDFKGKIIFSYLDADYQSTEKYKTFMKEHVGKYKDDPSHGILFLMYIPKYDVFCQFFCKSTLLREAVKMVDSLITAQCMRLKSNRVEGKKYVNLKHEPIQDLDMPNATQERLDKAIKMLLNEKKGNEDAGKTVEAGR